MASEDFALISDYAASGSGEAFAELVRRHAGMVFAVAKRVTGNAADAEEVAQDCFWVMAHSAGRLKPPLVPWLHRLVTCRAIDYLRKRKTERWYRQQIADLPPRSEGDPLLRLWPAVDEALLDLPDEQRLMLIRHFLEGATQMEVAAETGCSQKTVSRRIEEGLIALRKILTRRGVAMAVLLTGPAMVSLVAAEAPATLIAHLGRLAMMPAKAGAAMVPGVMAGGHAVVGPSSTPGAGVAVKTAAAGLWFGAIVSLISLAIVLVWWWSRSQPIAQMPPPGAATGAPLIAQIPPPSTALEMMPAYPLKISANARYLVGQDGRPFLWMGDSASDGIVGLPPEQMDRYLDDRQAKGVTVVQVELITHNPASDDAVSDPAGHVPFTRKLASGVSDFTATNELYFQGADAFIAKAAARGMCVLLYVSPTGSEERMTYGWYREMKANGRERLRAWGRWVGRRYQRQPNIVWANGSDATPMEAERWIIDEPAAGIRESGARQLMTAHVRRGDNPAEVFGSRPWLDLNNVYIGDTIANLRPLPLQQAMRQAHASMPVRPVFLIEAIFEGEHDATAAQLRRQSYIPYLCGGCGQIFGNNPVYFFDARFPHADPGRDWRAALRSPGSQDQARLSQVLKAHAWWKLEPDVGHATLVSDPRSGDAEIVAARASDGSLAMVYVPSTGTTPAVVAIAMDRLAGNVTARWYNPTSGTYFAAPGSPSGDPGTRTFATPGDNGTGTNDWLLILTAAAIPGLQP